MWHEEPNYRFKTIIEYRRDGFREQNRGGADCFLKTIKGEIIAIPIKLCGTEIEKSGDLIMYKDWSGKDKTMTLENSENFFEIFTSARIPYQTFCDHHYVNVSFNFMKMVCTKCDKEET